MKTIALAMTVIALAAPAGSAAAVDEFDTNGDHFASFGEVFAAYPKISRSNFRDIDINSDNRLSATEVQGGQAILSRGLNSSGIFRSTTEISGGSFVTYGALQKAYPGLPTSQTRRIDRNGDRRIDAGELAASQIDLGVYESGIDTRISHKVVDTDDSRFASLGELRAFYPNLSESDLRAFDVNRDRRISSSEYYSPRATAILGQNK